MSVNPSPGCSVAPFAIALRRFAKGPNIFFSPRNFHVLRLPQREGINGSRRPTAARITMTIAHADRRTGHGELDRPTETTSIVAFWTGHSGIPNWLQDTRRWVLLTVQHNDLARRRECQSSSCNVGATPRKISKICCGFRRTYGLNWKRSGSKPIVSARHISMRRQVKRLSRPSECDTCALL